MWRQARLPIFVAVADCILVVLALAISLRIRPFLPFGTPTPDGTSWPLLLWCIAPILWSFSMVISRSYDLKFYVRIRDELRNVLIGCCIAMFLFSGFLFFSYPAISRLQVLLFASLAAVLIPMNHLATRLFLRRTNSRSAQCRVLIIGANEIGRRLAQSIRQLSWIGFRFVGYLDDESKNDPDCIGTVDQAVAVAKQQGIEEVLIALPPDMNDRLPNLVHDLHTQTQANVRLVPDFFPLAFLRILVDEFCGMPLITLREPVSSSFQQIVKRTLDIVGSMALLILLSPILCVIALLIRLDSPGKVLFVQDRLGQNGHIFRMFKFRSMISDPEGEHRQALDSNGNDPSLHKTIADTRVTRFGRILRRWSLDELPQLYNVLRGDMSFVGPRPEVTWLVEKYEPWQRKRFSVPQGMTGWWQVNGRSEKPMHLSTEYDLFYIQNYSLWLDLIILWKTIRAVLSRKGAF